MHLFKYILLDKGVNGCLDDFGILCHFNSISVIAEPWQEDNEEPLGEGLPFTIEKISAKK